MPGPLRRQGAVRTLAVNAHRSVAVETERAESGWPTARSQPSQEGSTALVVRILSPVLGSISVYMVQREKLVSVFATADTSFAVRLSGLAASAIASSPSPLLAFRDWLRRVHSLRVVRVVSAELASGDWRTTTPLAPELAHVA